MAVSTKERGITSSINLTRALLGLTILASLGEITPTLAQAAIKTIQIEGQVNQAFPPITSQEQRRIVEQITVFEQRAKEGAAEAAKKGQKSVTIPIGDLDQIDKIDIRKREAERQKLKAELETEAGIPQQKTRLIGGMLATTLLALGALKASQSKRES